MISKVLYILTAGLEKLRSNSQLIFIAILLVVFPALFVWTTDSFFDTAHHNIETSEKQRVGQLHDTLTVAIQSNVALSQELIEATVSKNENITKIRILQDTDETLTIIAASDAELIGTTEDQTGPYLNLPGAARINPVILPVLVSEERVWQVFTIIDDPAGDIYLFSEHSFSVVDSTMSARRQQSYFGLTAIFLFMIGLAYWLNKQTDWQRKHALLQEQLEERDLFSNMIAHEFRAPLTAIKGYASFLQESETISIEEKRFADTINTSAHRLVLLVNDFLEVARLQSGKMKLELETIDIREVVTAVSKDQASSAKEKHLEFLLEPGTQELLVHTDRNRLTQIIINMVSNAIKYTEKGSITLACVAERGKAIIRIMDTGMGISAEDQKKLFTPFERVGGVEKTNTTGTGLGMYITKKLVMVLGGTIGIESIKGVGSHVVITLPLK